MLLDVFFLFMSVLASIGVWLVKRARIDIHNLIAELDAHQENTGEMLEEDDAAVVEDIRRRWK